MPRQKRASIADAKQVREEVRDEETNKKEKLEAAASMLKETELSKNEICRQLKLGKPQLNKFLKTNIVPNKGNAIFSSEEEGKCFVLVFHKD